MVNNDIHSPKDAVNKDIHSSMGVVNNDIHSPKDVVWLFTKMACKQAKIWPPRQKEWVVCGGLPWSFSIKDTLNKGHLSNQDTVCSPKHIELCTNLPLK